MFIRPTQLLWINSYFSKVIQMHRKCTDVLVFSGEKGEKKFEGLLNFTSLGLLMFKRPLWLKKTQNTSI